MRIQIHPSMQWGAVFSVPAIVVDRDLKMASPEQLRTLLWVLRHASECPLVEQVADALRYSQNNVMEYLAFWQEKGVLQLEGENTVHPAPEQLSVRQEHPKAEIVLEELPEVKPSVDQIDKRLEESPELQFLFAQAQEKLGRTIGYDGQCVLLMIHDHYGLPIEVILMIIAYCVEVHKTSFRYIGSVAKSWAQEEIDTIEKADEKISLLHRCNKLWREFTSATGITTPHPTAVQSAYLRSWSTEMGFDIDMILLAYEEMANHCTRLSFAYMNKVLRNWFEKDVHTPQQVSEWNQKFRDQRQRNGTAEQPPASYDIDEMERKLLYGPIKFKDKQ